MKNIVAILTSWGPAGLFVLSILDGSGVPLPAAVDALLITTAVLNPSAAYLAAAMAILGSVIGSMFLFTISRRGGKAYLETKTQSGIAAIFRRWFQTYGLITVFVPSFVPLLPLPLKIFVISAGALGVKPLSFFAITLLARVPRFLGMAYLGLQLGDNAMPWLKAHLWHLTGGAVVLGLLLVILIRLQSRGSQPR